MRNVHLVVVVAEGNLELKAVVIATAFLLHCVLEVGDVFTVTVPAETPDLACLLGRVKQRFLPLVVGAVRLDQVNDSEFILGVLFDICNLEVEPLSVGRRIMVVLQDQIVAVGVGKLHDTPQVAGLESGFKYERGVLVILFQVKGFQIGVVPV